MIKQLTIHTVPLSLGVASECINGLFAKWGVSRSIQDRMLTVQRGERVIYTSDGDEETRSRGGAEYHYLRQFMFGDALSITFNIAGEPHHEQEVSSIVFEAFGVTHHCLGDQTVEKRLALEAIVGYAIDLLDALIQISKIVSTVPFGADVIWAIPVIFTSEDPEFGQVEAEYIDLFWLMHVLKGAKKGTTAQLQGLKPVTIAAQTLGSVLGNARFRMSAGSQVMGCPTR